MVADHQKNDRTQSYIPIPKGTVFSRYRIIQIIGVGGMGEVYLAEDTELNRPVALKFIAKQYLSDHDVRARFKREAQAAAKLDHPNIVTVFEVGEYQGRPFFAMQHVDGLSLRDIIKSKELPLDRMINLAIQICDGLSKAHQAGIVHRDIKPSNIIMDADGRPKIVDFGLARVEGKSKLTKTGSTLGTFGYMSPEQVRGEEADHRSDLFSFGVVLYELIAGRPPFAGENEGAILHSITHDTPEPLARYKSDLPDGVQHIVNKALEKNPEIRYQTAADLLADLRKEQETSSRLSGVSVVSAPTGAKSKKGWILALVGIGIIAVILLLVSLLQKPHRPVAARQKQVTFAGDVSSPAISPNGEHLAYVCGRDNEDQRVMIQDLSGGSPVEVYRDRFVFDLKWSPDSRDLILTAWNDSISGVVVIPRLGGQHRRYPVFGPTIAWSPDGSRFAINDMVDRQFYFVDRKSGDITSMLFAEECDWLVDIDWSPNSAFLLASSILNARVTLWTIKLDGNVRNRVVDTIVVYSPRWSSNGDAIYYLEQREPPLHDLVKVDVDPKTGTRSGNPTVLLTGLQCGMYPSLSFACGGQAMAFLQSVESSNLWSIRLNPQPGQELMPNQLTQGTSEVSSPSISPDGRQVAFAMRAMGENHIFVMPIGGGGSRQLTHTSNDNTSPCWSPDGQQIAYSSSVDQLVRVSVVDAGGGIPKIFDNTEVSSLGRQVKWSSDGKILYHQIDGKNYRLLDPENGQETPLPVRDSTGMRFLARFSPDGRKIAQLHILFEEDVGHRAFRECNLEIVSLNDSISVETLPFKFMVNLIGWSADNKWVYYTSLADSVTTVIEKIHVGERITEKVMTLPWAQVGNVAMAPNCSTFVCVVERSQSDVFLVEDFDPDSK